MARGVGIEFTTASEAVRRRVATLKARQDAGQLRPSIKNLDAALAGPRDPDGSIRLDPRLYYPSPLHLVDVGA